MNFASCRLCAPLLVAFCLLFMGQSALAREAAPGDDPAPVANHLVNAEFECGAGGYYEGVSGEGDPMYIPNNWLFATRLITPYLDSNNMLHSDRNCVEDFGGEKIGGQDSLAMYALYLEWTETPGWAFDASVYQQVPVVSGTAYSLSGWMLSLCGGSTVPNDCPADVYMAKLLGIDPLGGVDPDAPSVVYVEDRNNFVGPDGVTPIRWRNMRTVAVAQAPTITVFARINSPFQHHGNHAFIDSLSLVQAPTATLTAVTDTVDTQLITVTWDGSLGPDIPLTPGGNFHLYYDVQVWHPTFADWRDLTSGVDGAGSAPYRAACPGEVYSFRVRAKAEQPEEEEGAWPNQRYPGAWSAPVEVLTPSPAPVEPLPGLDQRSYLPAIMAAGEC